MNVKTPILIVAVFCVLMTLACASEGPASIQEGNTAFEAGQFEQAQEAYDRALEAMPDSPEVAYNSANTLYRQELFGEAGYGLDVSAETADPGLSQYSSFNKGNSLYMSEEYEAAVEAYKQALRLDPTDREAKHNLELALLRIEEQQEQEQQEQEGEGEGEQEQEQQGNQEQEEGEGNTPGQQQQEQQPEDQEDTQGQEDEGSEEDGESSEEAEPEEGESSSTQSISDPGEVPPTGMTEEQAEQLLESIADNTETLREQIMLRNSLYREGSEEGVPGW